MFTVSDEEMLKIEQPMEYLIEKTKHKMQEVYQISQTKLRWSSTAVNLKSKKGEILLLP